MSDQDPIGEFIDAGTEYVLALIDARTMQPVERLNNRVLQSKCKLRGALVHLLQSLDKDLLTG